MNGREGTYFGRRAMTLAKNPGTLSRSSAVLSSEACNKSISYIVEKRSGIVLLPLQ